METVETNVVQESNVPQAYAEEKTGFFAKAKAGIKKHGKGIVIGAATAALIGAGAVATKKLSSTGGIELPAMTFEEGEETATEA